MALSSYGPWRSGSPTSWSMDWLAIVQIRLIAQRRSLALEWSLNLPISWNGLETVARNFESPNLAFSNQSVWSVSTNIFSFYGWFELRSMVGRGRVQGCFTSQYWKIVCYWFDWREQRWNDKSRFECPAVERCWVSRSFSKAGPG